MDPRVWGPHMWRAYHYVALGFPENPSPQDRQRYKQWYTTLHHVLPCNHCAEHYAQHIRQNPIDDFLDSPRRLFEWTVNVHNVVNMTLGKRIQLSVEDAIALYPAKPPHMSSSSPPGFVVVGGIIGLVVVAALVGRWSAKNLNAPHLRK